MEARELLLLLRRPSGLAPNLAACLQKCAKPSLSCKRDSMHGIALLVRRCKVEKANNHIKMSHYSY